MIEGMTLEYGSCSAYRDSIYSRATDEDDLGSIWVDDSIGALFKALEGSNQLNNTVRAESMHIKNDID